MKMKKLLPTPSISILYYIYIKTTTYQKKNILKLLKQGNWGKDAWKQEMCTSNGLSLI